jgi:NAD(P)-dependent dehydrogenase (short-subunit alcohol dehydrogenase family)
LARFSLSGYAAYAMMKGGVEVLTRYLAKELASRGIAANTMAPSAIETGHRRRLGPRRQAGQ